MRDSELTRGTTLTVVGLVALWVAAKLLYADFTLPMPVVALGVITGTVYGTVAVGLVLIYRSGRVINFAHVAVGSFAAAVLGLVVVKFHAPYWLVFPFALLLGALVSVTVEAAAVRRLRNAPRVMSIVATLGAATFLTFLSLTVNTQIHRGSEFPQPPHMPKFHIGVLLVTPSYAAMLMFTPFIVLGIVLFLKYSRYGIGLRAAADNRDAAVMAGISASRMSLLAWGIAGAVSAYAAILQFPQQGFVLGAGSASLGPGLLVRVLVPAVIARFTSIPIALLAGVVVGTIEQASLYNSPSGGQVDAVLFVVMLVALLFQTRRGGREDQGGSWIAVVPWKPLPEEIARLPLVRRLGLIGGITVFGLLAAILATSDRNALIFTLIVAYTLVGLSVYVVTGLSGQLSLGQFAFAGIGAIVSYHVIATTGNFFLGFLLAGLVTAAVSVVIGVPALRIRGLMLAVVTLAFAVMAEGWLFQQSWAFGSGKAPGRPILFGHTLDSAKSYYAFILPWLVVAVVLTRNVARGGIGRSLRAVRDNEDAARAFSVRATRLKLQAFALAGFLSGLGGAIYAHSLPQLDSLAFPSATSITITAITVIGGLSLLAGPLVGALYLLALPAFVPLDAAGLAASTLGWLILILYFPGGVAQVMKPARDAVVRFIARRAGLRDIDLEASVPSETESAELAAHSIELDERRAPAVSRAAAGAADVLLEVRGLTKHYGGIQAVDGVDLSVRTGETLGIIGPNGAGKTTLFELIGGFVAADAGTVTFDGRDVTRTSPERRAEVGLLRSFQDARLFPTMTVLESVQLACERAQRTRFMEQVVGLGRGSERNKEARARELLTSMGLERYRHAPINQLSTGTRRIAELAALIALEPKLLLLDEPSSGIAQRESEALAGLLQRLKDHLGATFIVIEHDMPLIFGISDRVVAMDTGRVIATGTPDQVRNDPAVISSYLGSDRVAIERSGPSARDVGTLDDFLQSLGIGANKVVALRDSFGTIDALRHATVQDMISIPGIGQGTASKICQNLPVIVDSSELALHG
jgi:ABC-type branched-subunit amino acid transport system ATPase component/ABC-type branched-subunit amino acid transport system permease subunit